MAIKKKDIVEGTVIRTDFPNIGIIEVEDKKVCVKGTIPGQQVKTQIQKARKSRLEGRLLEILKQSDLESETDVCPHFGICGGCFYSRLPYEEELRIKEEQVKRLLTPVIGEDVWDSCYRGIIPAPLTEGYRNKMEFSFGDSYKGGPLSLGMHRKGAFYDIVSVPDCRICDSDFTTILNCTLDYFSKRGTSYFHRLSHDGFLRHLLVRKGMHTGQIMADLVTVSDFDKELLAGWAESIRQLSLKGELTGILHTVNDRISDVVEDQGTEVLFGSAEFSERILGLDFKITPFSFFQTNSHGAERLYETVKDLMTSVDTVYDLYCGTGTIGQIVSDRANRVVGVEIVKEAVEAARENAVINGIDNITFICGDVLKVLDELSDPPDAIILDPPREGIHPKALPRICAYGAERIVYVSCKPTSLARDLEVIIESGYKPTFIKLCDMFARTANLESVVLLQRQD